MSKCLRLVILTVCIVNAAVSGALANGTLSGTVTGSGGQPLANAKIEVQSVGWGNYYLYAANADGNGFYTLSLPAGDYVLKATQPNSYYMAYYYNNAANMARLNAVTITENNTTTVSPALIAGAGAISGKITDKSGNPVSGQYVYVSNSTFGFSSASGQTASDGTFAFYGLLPGTTYYCYTYFNNMQTFYNGVTNYTARTPITITANQTTANINFVTPAATSTTKAVVVPLMN